MKIILLQGGMSLEREISLLSSGAIGKAIIALGHELIKIDPIDYCEIEDLIIALKKEKPDLVFIGLHGRYGEDGIIQAVLKAANLKFTASDHIASAIAFDKYIAASMAKIHDVPVPRQHILESIPSDMKQLIEYINFPMFVKPNSEGSSIGARLAENYDELIVAMEDAFKFDTHILLQQYISGRELTVGILGTQVLPVVEIKPLQGFYDYENKYVKGKTEFICPAKLTPSETRLVQMYAEKIFQTAGCTIYGRIDFMFDGDKFYFLEINSLPGMTELSLLPRAAKENGIEFNELIDKIINLSLK